MDEIKEILNSPVGLTWIQLMCTSFIGCFFGQIVYNFLDKYDKKKEKEYRNEENNNDEQENFERNT